MKNLKISNKLKALVLAGSMVVLGSFISANGKSDVEKYYDYHLSGVIKYAKMFNDYENTNFSIFDYKKFLIDNEMIPLEYSDDFIEKYKNDDGCYYEKQVYDNSFDEPDWKIANKTELEVFSGILNKGKDYVKKIYTVSYENGVYKKKQFYDYLNFDFDKDYFVCLDDPIDLIDPEQYYYYNGVQKNKVKK